MVQMKDWIRLKISRFISRNKGFTVGIGVVALGAVYYLLSIIFAGVFLVLAGIGGFYLYRLISKADRRVKQEEVTQGDIGYQELAAPRDQFLVESEVKQSEYKVDFQRKR